VKPWGDESKRLSLDAQINWGYRLQNVVKQDQSWNVQEREEARHFSWVGGGTRKKQLFKNALSSSKGKRECRVMSRGRAQLTQGRQVRRRQGNTAKFAKKKGKRPASHEKKQH